MGTENDDATPPPPPPLAPEQGRAYQGPPPVHQGHPGYAPYPGQPVMATPAMVAVPITSQRDDYSISCMGTVCCGGIGCLAMVCCCNTPTGRYGSATGCIVHSVVQVVVAIIVLALIGAKAVACNSDRHPPTSLSDCKGIWVIKDGYCVLEEDCPRGYKQIGDSLQPGSYCKNNDWSTCLGTSSVPMAIVETVLFAFAAVASVYYRRIYKRQIDQLNSNPNAYAPMVGAFPQPAYAYPAQPYPMHVQPYPAHPYTPPPHTQV